MSNASKRGTATASTAPKSDEDFSQTEGADEDFSKIAGTREQIGFAPYWNPKVGKKLFFTVMGFDNQDPTFPRYICRAEAKDGVLCHRGKAADAQEVHVAFGESFTISAYGSDKDADSPRKGSLDDAFSFYLMSGLQPRLQLTALKKVPTSTPPNQVWTWDLFVDPKVMPKLKVLKAAHVAKQMAERAAGGNEEREQLDA